MIAAEYAGITFTAKELDAENPRLVARDACQGCHFEREKYATCVAVGRLAVEAGLPDCETRGPTGGNVVYVRTTKGDPRQLDCAGAVQTSEAS